MSTRIRRRFGELPSSSTTREGWSRPPRPSTVAQARRDFWEEIHRLSAAGIPTITLVFGSSTAGGAYVPGMSDYIVMQKQSAKVFLAGPPLVKMAINEDAVEEDLGGAEMHSRVSGLSDYLAEDELDALRIGRGIGLFARDICPRQPLDRAGRRLFRSREPGCESTGDQPGEDRCGPPRKPGPFPCLTGFVKCIHRGISLV